MNRKALKTLRAWLTGPSRKPLVIRGARQVGKTSLVRMFAEEQVLDLVEVNLERHMYLRKVFSGLDTSAILLELEGVAGKAIVPGKTLLFLDEIQAVPEAIASLRYFFEDIPDLAVVAAGSLLEFALSDHSFSMPVGRIEYLHLGPVTFLEFLEAVDPFSAEWLAGFPFSGESYLKIPESHHKRLLNRIREFLFVGGMPEAVSVFAETGDYYQVSRVHDSVIDTYVDDFAKYARQVDLVRLQNLFKAVPGHIGKKVVYRRLAPEESSTKTRETLELLVKARLASKVIHTHGNGVPLGAEMQEKVFKLLFLDAGLLNRMYGIPAHTMRSIDENALINAGVMAEQFIGQHLLQDPDVRSPLHLHYWQREGKAANAELDYLVQIDSEVYPLEVKAGKTGTLKSLHQFMREKRKKLAIRMDLGPPSVQRVNMLDYDRTEIDYPLLSLPLYCIERLADTVRSVDGARLRGL